MKPKTLNQLVRANNILDLHDQLPFGKYKGATVFAILDGDPSYVVWMHDNTQVKFKDRIIESARRIFQQREDACVNPRDGWLMNMTDEVFAFYDDAHWG